MHPGPAHPTQTRIDSEVVEKDSITLTVIKRSEMHGEVGGKCTFMVYTGDAMGNTCKLGGAKLVCYCGEDKGYLGDKTALLRLLCSQLALLPGSRLALGRELP